MSYPDHTGRVGGGSLPRGILLPDSSNISNSTERAGLMWRILSSIEYPTHVLESGDGDLFIERISADQHYCVVLKHRNGRYNFASAHCYSSDFLQQAKRKYLPTRAKGVIKKSLTKLTVRDLFSTLQVLDHSSALKPANGWSGATSSDPLRQLAKSIDPASSGRGDDVSAAEFIMSQLTNECNSEKEK